MGRRKLSAAEQLAAEAHSIEALLESITPSTEMIQEYWQMSMDLVGLVLRIEALAAEPVTPPAEEAYARLRSELTFFESRVHLLEQEDPQD